MNRRELFTAGMGGALLAMADSAVAAPASVQPFALNYAPEFRTFQSAGPDEIAKLHFMHDAGFRALQDLGMNLRPVEQQAAIARELEHLGMTMGVFTANQKTFKTTDLTTANPDGQALFLSEIQDSIEVAKRVNAKWILSVPGFEAARIDRARQIANIVELYKRAAGMLEPHGIIMVVEPVSWVDGPLLINDLATGYMLCKAVGSPSCKMLCDFYHQQVQRGDLLDSIEQAWDEIVGFHISDAPARLEPGTGEINYRNVVGYLKAKNFRGVVGMEHNNSRPGRDGDLATIAAYREIDKTDPQAVQTIMRTLPQRLAWR